MVDLLVTTNTQVIILRTNYDPVTYNTIAEQPIRTNFAFCTVISGLNMHPALIASVHKSILADVVQFHQHGHC